MTYMHVLFCENVKFIILVKKKAKITVTTEHDLPAFEILSAYADHFRPQCRRILQFPHASEHLVGPMRYYLLRIFAPVP